MSSSQSKTLKPRRKFNLSTEVRRFQRLAQAEESSEWSFVPMKRVLNRIINDISAQNLFVVGGKAVEPVPFSLRELIQHQAYFPPAIEKKCSKASKCHVRSIPLFSRAEYQDFQLRGALKFSMRNRSFQEMLNGYQKEEHAHKTLEDHHPDGPGWKPSMEKTMEVVFDIFSSLLRDNALTSAFKLLWKILDTPKYSELNVDGVYNAMIHICIRGVDSEALSVSSTWRRKSQVQNYAIARTYQFFDGSDIFGLIRSTMNEYRKETNIHVAAMESEMRILRLTGHHDRSKYNFSSAFFYSWYWGCYQQLSPVNQFRLRSEKPSPIENALSGYPTMWSLGKTFANGIAASDDLKEAVGTTLKDVASEVFHDAKETTSEVLEEAKTLLGEFHEEADTSLEKASQLVERLTGTMEGMIETFSSLTSAFKGVFSSLSTSFASIPSICEYIPSFEKFVAILKDYIIFVNVDSPLLKSMTVLSLLHNLGFSGDALKYFKELMGSMKGEVIEEEAPSAPTDGHFTSGLLSMSFAKLVYLVSATFASLVKGACIGPTALFSLMRKLQPIMKEVHFLGAGCVGFERIITFISKLYTYVSQWIKENIFGVEDKSTAFAKRVSLLTLMANYFSTEAGYDSIRMNVNMRQKATTVLPMYLEMITQARADKALTRFVRDIESVRRNSQQIHDFITRLEAVSNFVPTMFHAQFVGEPGVGKSFLMKTFTRDVQKSLYPDEPGDSVYSYNPNLEFFDGYSGQKIFIMDDCFRMQEPKHLTTLIGLITNTPVILPMANLSDKGIQLTSDVMLSSTNTAYPIGKDVLCMEAVHRRRHMLIEVVIDPAVRDSSTGQFSISLYRKKYKEEDLHRFPHLTFNLMRPVPREWGGAATPNVTQSASEFDELQKYARKLKEVNVSIMTPGGKNIDPTYYFSEENRPPEPIDLPCVGWTYEQLVHNFAARYCAFRGHEQTFSTRRKYAHAEYAIAEVEGLINQSPDILDGVELPFKPTEYRPYKMISHLFGDVHHPYGAEDSIGQRVAESKGDVMPELDDIDFEEIVNKILDEHVPTALSLEEEYARIASIRSRSKRLAHAEPHAMANRLRVIDAEDEMGVPRSLIRIVPHYTVWEGWGLPREPSKLKIFDRMRDIEPMEAFYSFILTSLALPKDEKSAAMSKFKSSMTSFVYGALAYYPDNDLFGSRKRTKSPFPLYFLQKLRMHRGDWHLDVSDFILEPFSAEFMEVTKGGDKYNIPIDAALMLSLNDTFRLFCLEFADLSTKQQEFLVEDAKWRNTITGFYNFATIKESCKKFFKRASYHCMEYFISPITLIARKYPQVIKWAALIALFGAGIWAIKSISKLFLGKEVVEGRDTSRFMQKGVPSLIRYHGHPTTVEGKAHEAAFQANTTLKTNIRQVAVSSMDGQTYISQALMSGQFMFLNTHTLDMLEGDTLIFSIFNPSSTESQQFIVPRDNVEKLQNSDLVCVYSNRFPVYPRLRKKLISQAEYDHWSFEGDFLIASRYKNQPSLEFHQFQRKARKLLLRSDRGMEVDMAQAIILSGNTIVGKSGSPVLYIPNSGRPAILGLQAWAMGAEHDPQIAVQILTQENYDDLVKNLSIRIGAVDCQLACPVEVVPETGTPTAFCDQDYNSVIGKVADGQVIGRVKGSQIQKSVIAHHMEDDGYVTSRVPAIVSEDDKRGWGKEHFLSHSLGKFTRGTLQPFLPNELNEAREWTKRLFQYKLDKDQFRLLEFSEIVTGTREDGSNPMNLKSSPGLPFVKERDRGKGKSKHFSINEEGELDFVREGLLEEFEQFYEDLTQFKIPYSLAYDFPKDELRPRDKALGTQNSPPKTRTVVCMNMFYIMAWRYLTLDFWSSMHRAADGSFPFCPGMNPEGPDWTTAFRYLTRHPNVVDFDVSNWDGFLNSELFYAAGEVISSFLDLDPRDQRALNTILLGVQNSFIQYERWVYLKSRGMISGFPGTAEMNTTSHILLFVYIYILLTKGSLEFQSLEALQNNVSFLVYGDDIIISFSDEIKHLVNGKSIAAMYSEIGYPITSGNKTEEIQESKTIWNCSFLKSTWNHLHSGIYLRKMDIEIANDLLYWCRAKEDPLEQFLSNSVDALRIVFCHGKETFDAFLHKLNCWLRRQHISPILYSYKDFYRDYMVRYYITDGN